MPCAAILTALRVEYLEVRAHLSEIHEETHPNGTIYERGKFAADGSTWDVGIVEIGAGNPGAAVQAERAIAYFNPDVILFVGVAGGIKDVALGDVVASTKVYEYESGKAEETFSPRPEVGLSSYGLEQRAIAEAKKTDWLRRLTSAPSQSPKVYVAPIAAGAKVVASTKSEVFKFLQSNYGDAIAVEMEGFGFLDAARANQQVFALVIRGISDLIYNKTVADNQGYQKIAAKHASAFAFEILAKYDLDRLVKPYPHIDKNKAQKRETDFLLRRILILSANPRGEITESTSNEIRRIETSLNKVELEKLRKGKNSIFEPLVIKVDIKANSLLQTLSSIEPDIIHISGYEDGIQKLTIEENARLEKTSDIVKLTGGLFEFSPKNTECIILSRCYSEDQAKEIVKYIKYVIGIDKEVDEEIAIDFLDNFYYHVGKIRSVKESYNAAFNHIERTWGGNESLFIFLEREIELLELKLNKCEARIQKAPENSELWQQKGGILQKLERHEKAIIAYQKALELDNGDYEVWWKKGVSLAKNNQYLESTQSYEYAVGLNPPFPDRYVINRELAWVLSVLGENQRSIVQYKSTLRSEPRYRAAKYEKKQVYKKMYSKKHLS
jgi:nucleoside phosphorylase